MRRSLQYTLLGIFLFSAVVGVLAGFVANDWLTRQFIERDIAATNADILNKFHAFDVLLEQEEKLIDRRMESALAIVIDELLRPSPSFAGRTQDQLVDLSRRAGVDNIYIIDRNTVVVATDFTPDMGFELGTISGEMRAFLTDLVGSGRYVADRINMSSKTGILYKYGYLSPPGSEYIAEVSIDVRKFLARERSQAFVDFLFGSFFRDLVRTHQFLTSLDINMVNPVGRFSLFDSGSELPLAVSERLRTRDYIIEQSDNLWRVYSRVSPVNSRLSTANFLAITATYNFTKLAELVRTVILFLVGTLILASAIAYAVAARISARQIVERIETVRRGVSTIAGGNYGHELTVGGHDEINDIANDINIMRVQIGRDMEEKEKAREAAEAASRAKSQFLSSVSHELRTPLNAIAGYAQLLHLEEKKGTGSERSEHLSKLLKATNQLARLIDNVLDLSQAEKGVLSLHIRTVAPEPLVEAAIEMIESHAGSRGIELRNRIRSHALPNVHADPDRFSQVVANLLSNSVKYCSEGDNIYLDAEVRQGGFLRITVTDTGPGIPPDKSDRLFQWFERLGRETGSVDGIGIGLALCHDLVTRMNGRIGFENLARGCSFWIELPIDPADAVAEHVESEPCIPAGSAHPARPSILYIEDSTDLIDLMRAIFKHFPGYTLYTANDAESGLRMATRHLPDLILMDINLPGMDGIAACRRLKNNLATARIPVIAITGAAMVDDVEKASGTDFFTYITKPFPISAVRSSISAALHARSRETR